MRYKISKHKTHNRYFCERGEHCYCKEERLDNLTENEYCMYCGHIIGKVAKKEKVREDRVFMIDRILGRDFVTL